MSVTLCLAGFLCGVSFLFCGGSLGCGGFGHGSLNGGSCGFLAAAATGAALLGSFRLGGEECFVIVNEFDEAHLGVVTKTVTGFEDAGVTTGTVSNFLSYFAEEFRNCILVLEVGEDQAAVSHAVLF